MSEIGSAEIQNTLVGNPAIGEWRVVVYVPGTDRSYVNNKWVKKEINAKTVAVAYGKSKKEALEEAATRYYYYHRDITNEQYMGLAGADEIRAGKTKLYGGYKVRAARIQEGDYDVVEGNPTTYHPYYQDYTQTEERWHRSHMNKRHIVSWLPGPKAKVKNPHVEFANEEDAIAWLNEKLANGELTAEDKPRIRAVEGNPMVAKTRHDEPWKGNPTRGKKKNTFELPALGNPNGDAIPLHESLEQLANWAQYEAEVVREAAKDIDDKSIESDAKEQADAMDEAAEELRDASDQAAETAAEIFNETGIASVDSDEELVVGNPENKMYGIKRKQDSEPYIWTKSSTQAQSLLEYNRSVRPEWGWELVTKEDDESEGGLGAIGGNPTSDLVLGNHLTEVEHIYGVWDKTGQLRYIFHDPSPLTDNRLQQTAYEAAGPGGDVRLITGNPTTGQKGAIEGNPEEHWGSKSGYSVQNVYYASVAEILKHRQELVDVLESGTASPTVEKIVRRHVIAMDNELEAIEHNKAIEGNPSSVASATAFEGVSLTGQEGDINADVVRGNPNGVDLFASSEGIYYGISKNGAEPDTWTEDGEWARNAVLELVKANPDDKWSVVISDVPPPEGSVIGGNPDGVTEVIQEGAETIQEKAAEETRPDDEPLVDHWLFRQWND